MVQEGYEFLNLIPANLSPKVTNGKKPRVTSTNATFSKYVLWIVCVEAHEQ